MLLLDIVFLSFCRILLGICLLKMEGPHPHTYRVYRFFRDIFEKLYKKIGIPIFKILYSPESDQSVRRPYFCHPCSAIFCMANNFFNSCFYTLVHHVRPEC